MRYFQIFSRPLYVPILIILSFILSFSLLLFFSNAEISGYAARVVDGKGDYVLPLRFTLSDMDEKAGKALLDTPGVRNFQWSASTEGEKGITVLSQNSYLSTDLLKKLEENPKGVIVPAGYQRVTGKDRLMIEGQEFLIIGEDDQNISYEKGRPLRVYLSPASFSKMGFSQVFVQLFLEGFPSSQEMGKIVETLQSQGMSIGEIAVPDFENDLMVKQKGALLLYLMILFIFIGLNILALFNYVLSTRQRGLSILRTFGLSQRKGSSLIAWEMMTYSTVASVFVLLLFFSILHRLSHYFHFTDVLIFLFLANAGIWLATKIMASILLSKPLGSLIKENWNE